LKPRATSSIVAMPEALSSAPLLILSASLPWMPRWSRWAQDDRLGLQRRVRALDQADHVAALALLDLGLQLDGDIGGQVEALDQAFRRLGRGQHGVQRRRRAGEQLGAALQAQAGQARRLGAAHIGHALGVVPGHPPFLVAADRRARTGGVFSRAGGRQGQDADRAALGGLGALDVDVAVVGADLGLQAAGGAAQHDDDLALHVQARVVVAAAFGGDDAVADEDQRRGDRGLGLAGLGRGQVVLAEGQGARLAVGAGVGDAALVGRAVGRQGHLLQVGAVVAGRLDAHQRILRGHVVGGDVVAARAGLAAFQQVVGQEAHVRLDGVGRRREAERGGLGGGGAAGLAWRCAANGLDGQQQGDAGEGGATGERHQGRLQGRAGPAKARTLARPKAACRDLADLNVL
jgi:hypothetical protein